jgi:pyrroloquinoline quinone (PQQ) biosynthesis protein C
MLHTTTADDFRQALSGKDLLTHPFYVRWQRGEVSIGELQAYAGQYRHFEAAFPGYLRDIAAQVELDSARDVVLRNLEDEAGGPVTHVELFEDFALAIDAPAAAPAEPATQRLLDTYAELVAGGPAAGLAAVVAYEIQFPAVAATKADGLRRDHGLDSAGTAFWDLHSELDGDHARWGIDALNAMTGDSELVLAAAGRAADAWWTFLDERESAAGIASQN